MCYSDTSEQSRYHKGFTSVTEQFWLSTAGVSAELCQLTWMVAKIGSLGISCMVMKL